MESQARLIVKACAPPIEGCTVPWRAGVPGMTHVGRYWSPSEQCSFRTTPATARPFALSVSAPLRPATFEKSVALENCSRTSTLPRDAEPGPPSDGYGYVKQLVSEAPEQGWIAAPAPPFRLL